MGSGDFAILLGGNPANLFSLPSQRWVSRTSVPPSVGIMYVKSARTNRQIRKLSKKSSDIH